MDQGLARSKAPTDVTAGGVILSDRPVVAAVVSQQGLFREGVERILRHRGFSVGYSATLVRDLLAKLRDSVPPDVVLLLGALSLDEMDALRTARIAVPSAAILAVAEEDCEPVLLERAISVGVDALLPIDLSAEVLVEAIQLVLLGERFVCVEFIQQLLVRRDFTARLRGPNPTKREVDILRLLVTGAPNKKIADWLNSTEGAVKVELRSLLRKLGVANRTQAAIWAMRSGLLCQPKSLE